jgi:hypothetical protein
MATVVVLSSDAPASCFVLRQLRIHVSGSNYVTRVPATNFLRPRRKVGGGDLRRSCCWRQMGRTDVAKGRYDRG